MLKADKHLHPNEKLIRLKRNKPFFLGAAVTFCDSEVNQTILHLLIKNLIQSRYKMLYSWWGGREGEITAVFLHKGFGLFLTGNVTAP